MAAGQDSEAIIATLEEAKVKLGEAQRHTFAGLTRLGKIRSAIEFTLGRLGRGNPAITLLRDAEKSIKDRAIEINALSARVDKAIAEILETAGGGAGVPSPGPASNDAVPPSRLHTYYVMAGNTPVLVHNTGPTPRVSTTISRQKQGRHVKGDPLHAGTGKSYFNSQADAQSVLAAYHSGDAAVLGWTSNGSIVVRCENVTGYNNNPGAGFLDQPTNVFMIKGTRSPSVVPINPNWTP